MSKQFDWPRSAPKSTRNGIGAPLVTEIGSIGSNFIDLPLAVAKANVT